MVDAPEKIWANGLGCYGTAGTDGIEYTRSDIVAELAAENERLKNAHLPQATSDAFLAFKNASGAADEYRKRAWAAEAKLGALASTGAVKEAGAKLAKAVFGVDLVAHPRATSTVVSHETANVSDKPEDQQEPVAWRDDKGRTLDKLMSMWRKRDEALDRGSWLGVSEIAGRLVRPKDEVREELRSLAIDGKIEREDFSNGTFWRGVLPSYITRPSEQAVTEAMIVAATEEYFAASFKNTPSDAMRIALKAAMEAGGRHD